MYSGNGIQYDTISSRRVVSDTHYSFGDNSIAAGGRRVWINLPSYLRQDKLRTSDTDTLKR